MCCLMQTAFLVAKVTKQAKICVAHMCALSFKYSSVYQISLEKILCHIYRSIFNLMCTWCNIMHHNGFKWQGTQSPSLRHADNLAIQEMYTLEHTCPNVVINNNWMNSALLFYVLYAEYALYVRAPRLWRDPLLDDLITLLVLVQILVKFFYFILKCAYVFVCVNSITSHLVSSRVSASEGDVSMRNSFVRNCVMRLNRRQIFIMCVIFIVYCIPKQRAVKLLRMWDTGKTLPV